MSNGVTYPTLVIQYSISTHLFHWQRSLRPDNHISNQADTPACVTAGSEDSVLLPAWLVTAVHPSKSQSHSYYLPWGLTAGYKHTQSSHRAPSSASPLTPSLRTSIQYVCLSVHPALREEGVSEWRSETMEELHESEMSSFEGEPFRCAHPNISASHPPWTSWATQVKSQNSTKDSHQRECSFTQIRVHHWYIQL